MNKNILITGANGFLGSSVCAAFAKSGAAVFALHRAGSDLTRLNQYCPSATKLIVNNDANNLSDLLKHNNIDCVIHTAAAQSGGEDEKSVRDLVQTNLLFGTLLLSAMRQNNVSYFINTGTAWQNYNQSDYNPVNLYAATKQAFEDIITYFANTGLNVVNLRLFDTYGPHDPRAKITNLLKRIAASGEALAMSPGGQQFDLVHVDDVAAAYVQAAQLLFDQKIENNTVFAVSSGAPIPLKDFTALFEKVRSVKCNIEWGGREYRAREPMVPWKNGTPLPGWQPRIDLETGLKDL